MDTIRHLPGQLTPADRRACLCDLSFVCLPLRRASEPHRGYGSQRAFWQPSQDDSGPPRRALETRRLFIFGGASHTGAMSGARSMASLRSFRPADRPELSALPSLQVLRQDASLPRVESASPWVGRKVCARVPLAGRARQVRVNTLDTG